MKCPKCNEQINEAENFCQHCGTPIEKVGKDNKEGQGTATKTISSAGTYSGTMSKGKTSKGWKLFWKLIIAVVLIGAVALVIWFQVDPKAGEKLANIAGGLLIMAIFIFFVYRSAKKGKYKKRNHYEDDYWDSRDNDDNDFDGGDDDDD